jgi:hypothetical protein
MLKYSWKIGNVRAWLVFRMVAVLNNTLDAHLGEAVLYVSALVFDTNAAPFSPDSNWDTALMITAFQRDGNIYINHEFGGQVSHQRTP